MQLSTPEKTPSPPKSGRVEDGKIRKIKAANKSDATTAIQHFNGKTYACESCKRGHRVQKCDHGKTRPISETNQPGRPSGGQKRGCQCPRNCACTTKSCKCERDCACTQEMYLIVRVDGPPTTLSREATLTPKPVWEDANGHKMTLKKVWTDANGKVIDDDEYQDRKRRMKEREEGVTSQPDTVYVSVKSGCCASKTQTPVSEPDIKREYGSDSQSQAHVSQPVSSGGCRHRQNVAATSAQPPTNGLVARPIDAAAKPATEPWMAACSCGSGCSCLYCPDHPNNTTSINHTQQQVRNLAEKGYHGADGVMPVSFGPENTSRSCMGGRPTFFLSRTPGVSQQQMAQLFPENLDPSAIYLSYPIQQHSWTSQPLVAHCSHHAPSPATAVIAMTPDASEDNYIEPLPAFSEPSFPWDLLPSDANGTWDFSDGQFGNTTFSWTDFDASHGTDYSIGQATVASMPVDDALTLALPSLTHHSPMVEMSMDGITSPIGMGTELDLAGQTFATPAPAFDPDNIFLNFDPHPHREMPTMLMDDGFAPEAGYTGRPMSSLNSPLEPFGETVTQPSRPSCCGSNSASWIGLDPFTEQRLQGEATIPNSPPIANPG